MEEVISLRKISAHMPRSLSDIVPVILFILGGWCIWHLFLGMPVDVGPTDLAPVNVVRYAFAAALLIALGLLFSVNTLIKSSGKEDENHSFWEVIYSEDCNPSLSLFQFLAWTIIVVIAFLAFSLIRLKCGQIVAPVDSFPLVLLGLMGLSVATPLVSGSSSFSYAEEKPGSQTDEKKICEKTAFKEMLFIFKPYHKLSLTRFQLFCWTFIGILIYIVIMGATLATTVVSKLALPDVDPLILGLMGLSSLSYLGGKYFTAQAAAEAAEKAKESPAPGSVSPAPGSASPAPAAPGVTVTSGETPLAVVPKEVSSYRGVSDQVRDYIISEHPQDIREKLKARIEAANRDQLIRYFLVGPNFYYLIENGQLVASSSIITARSDLLKAVETEQKSRGKSEILYLV
jgi:hypothetical protein